jgi:agmatine deiminase
MPPPQTEDRAPTAPVSPAKAPPPAEGTPAALGYRMPAEWAPHAATWLSWPRREGISFPGGGYERAVPALVKMVGALAESEPVHINVCDADHEAEVRRCLRTLPGGIAHVRFFHIPTNEPWCRDHGPIFLTRDEEPHMAIVDFEYNAWGWKYPPFEFDDAVPTRVAEMLRLPVYHPGLVLEGGSIDVNGAGTVLTTESCLLNPNRNPTLKKAQIETALRDYLGVRKVLWLGDGIEGDDTDGHVDDLTRFVNRTTVVTVIEEDTHDNNYEPLQDNLHRLRAMSVEDESPLHVLTLPMPSKVVREGLRLPASYANFYIANKAVLLPTFGDPHDAWAASVLRQAFPGRRVTPIDCRELIWGLGAFHCLTQQQPIGPVRE